MAEIIEGLSFADYTAIDREHFSRVKYLDRSPKHYRHQGDISSSALTIGGAAHTLILEGREEYLAQYVHMPGNIKVRRGKLWDEFRARTEGDGQTILTASEAATVSSVAAAVSSDVSALKVLERCQRREVTILWESHGIQLKSRLDMAGDTMIADLKTTRELDLRSWTRDVMRYHTLAQFASYREAWLQATGQTPTFVAVVAETAQPYDVACVLFSDDDLAYGWHQFSWWLESLERCRSTDHWPGVVDTNEEAYAIFERPAWAELDGTITT